MSLPEAIVWKSLRIDGSSFLSSVVGYEPAVSFSEQDFLDAPCHRADGSTSLFLGHAFRQNWSSDLSSDCVLGDWIVLLLFFVLVLSVNWFLRTIAWDYVARRLLGPKRSTGKRVEKLVQVMTSNTFHSIQAMLAYRIIIRDKAWLWRSELWFQDIDNGELESDLKLFYMFYVARFLSDLVFLCFEHKRSDFLATAAHHIVTVGLILQASAQDYRHIRAGGVILSFFSWSDLPLLTAKACVYLSQSKQDLFQFAANRCFEIFVVVFFLTHNVMFNYVAWHLFGELGVGTPEIWQRPADVSGAALLACLSLLHFFWLGMVIKALVKMFGTGEVEDHRSDDEEDEAHDEPIARKKKQ